MSRFIDLENLPLSAEDKQYLLDRGQEQLVHSLEQGEDQTIYSPFGDPVYQGQTGDMGYDKEDEGWRPTITKLNPDGSEEDDSTDDDSDGDEGDDVPPYLEWSNDDLRKELKARGLSADGNKSEMAARLDQADEAEKQD